MATIRATSASAATKAALGILFVAAAALVGLAPAALAHGEIIEASPSNDAIVGGEIAEIAIQFFGIAHPGTHSISIKDPSGTPVAATGSIEQKSQRLTLPIEPLTKRGIHIVNVTVEGVDDDGPVELSYSFEYLPSAAPPDPIQFEQETVGLDAVTMALIALTSASIIGFGFLIRHRLKITAPTSAKTDLARSPSLGPNDNSADPKSPAKSPLD